MSNITDIEFVYKTFYKRLHRIALQVVNDADAAEDIVQEVFIHIWKKRDEISINTTIEGYLIRSTVNRALNYIEKNKRMMTVELQESNFNGTVDYAKMSNEFDNKLLQKVIQQALDSLPPKCKTIFVLSRFEGMKNREIAEHLDISIKTVENQMTIALKALNQQLKPRIEANFPELLFILTKIFNFF